MSSREIALFYDTVLSIVKSAGQIIRDKISDRNKSVDFKTSEKDLVTETDNEVENVLIGNLSKKFPNHKFIAEEATAKGASTILTDAPTWIIDPIDGTINFVHSFPHSCISIALFINQQPEIGIVYNPMLEQLFTAVRGKGAFLNGKPIKVSDTTSLSNALIICENFGSSPTGKIGPEVVENSVWLVKECHSLRALGSAALNLCMIACGAADAYFQYGLSIWDIAAGELIIREAGGLVTNANGEPLERFGKSILVASSKELHKILSNRLAETEAKLLKY